MTQDVGQRKTGARHIVLAVAIALAATVAGTARTASAAVIYVDVNPDRVVQQGTFFLDIDNDGNRDLLFDHNLGCVGACLSSANVSALGGAVLLSSPGEVTPLAAGAIVGPGSTTFGSGGLLAEDRFFGSPAVTTSESGLWDNGLLAFLGFSFVNASGIHYGWVRLHVNETDNVITVFDGAYESTVGGAIVAGARGVPEPTTLALLLLGGVAAVHRMRRPSA